MSQIPVIELDRVKRGASHTVVKELDKALRELGFFALAAHGVARDTILEARTDAREFFAQDAAKKADVLRPKPRVLRGFLPIGHEALSRSIDRDAPPDLNESFQIGPLSASDNLWPSAPA